VELAQDGVTAPLSDRKRGNRTAITVHKLLVYDVATLHCTYSEHTAHTYNTSAYYIHRKLIFQQINSTNKIINLKQSCLPMLIKTVDHA